MHEKHVKCRQKISKTQFMHLSQFLPGSSAISNLLRDVAISRSQKKCESAEKYGCIPLKIKQPPPSLP